MLLSPLKSLLPDRPFPLPIINGPFRGATIRLNPRCSLRKVFGIYEHELNSWLERVLPQVNIVLDVGANDGYFTFGCATALQRLQKSAQVVAFEPLDMHFSDLETTLQSFDQTSVMFHLHHAKVGADNRDDTVTLDAIATQHNLGTSGDRALIKIDVEGAELDVIAGADQWLNPQHFFLIEVHHESFLSQLKQQFGDRGIALQQVNQHPLPVLGRETRSPANWWLVSDLTASTTA